MRNQHNVYGYIYLLDFISYIFRPFQARNIRTSELAAIKIVKLDPGRLTVQTWHNIWVFLYCLNWIVNDQSDILGSTHLSVSQKRSISDSQDGLGQDKVSGFLLFSVCMQYHLKAPIHSVILGCTRPQYTSVRETWENLWLSIRRGHRSHCETCPPRLI